MDTDDEMLRHKREKLRKLLLDYDSNWTPLKPRTESRYENPMDFLNNVNQFQKFVERYFDRQELFGEFGEKFPIISYMRIYDMLKLYELFEPLRFRCTYTRDGLGGWMNILAINESEEGGIEARMKDIVISEHWNKIEQFGKLRMYLDSLSAKKHVYTSFTEMGCLQYLHFIEFGEAFAYEWHAASCRKYVLTSITDIPSRNFLFKIVEGNTENLLKIFKCEDDLKPTIVMYDDKCSIEWVEFHTHEGVFRRRYEIEKNKLRDEYNHRHYEYAVPGKIKLVNDITLLRMVPMFRY